MSTDKIPTKPLSDSPHITIISPSGQSLQLYDTGAAWHLICIDRTLPNCPGITWLSFAKDGKLSKLAKFILERDEYSMHPKPQEKQ